MRRLIFWLLPGLIILAFAAFLLLPKRSVALSGPMVLRGYTNIAGEVCALFDLKPLAVSHFMNLMSRDEMYCEMRALNAQGNRSTNLSVFRSFDHRMDGGPTRLTVAIPSGTTRFRVKYHQRSQEGRVTNQGGPAPPTTLFILPWSRVEEFESKEIEIGEDQRN